VRASSRRQYRRFATAAIRPLVFPDIDASRHPLLVDTEGSPVTKRRETWIHRTLTAKKNFQFQRRYSAPVDRATGLVCDQTVILTVTRSAEDYPKPLRRIRYRDPETGKKLVFLTNNFSLPALTIDELYRSR
jgi:hypothetical protein